MWSRLLAINGKIRGFVYSQRGMAFNSPSLKLSSGHSMPTVGLGTAELDDEETVRNCLTTALDAGYRNLDTAYVYQSEKLIGKVLKDVLDIALLEREELFITSKLPFNALHPDVVKHFCERSLASLNTSYLDLYLIHCPVATKHTGNDDEVISFENDRALTEHINLTDTWKAMESLVEKGLVKSIGLSNFNSKQIQRIYEAAKIKPAALQVECHAYLPQYELVDFCKKLDITVAASSPLGSPDFPEFVRVVLGMKDYNRPTLLENDRLKFLAEKYNKTPAQILLRYLVQRGIAVIPKSSHPERIQQNINIFNFTLMEEDVNQLKSMASGVRYITYDFWKGFKEHPEYPFHEAF
ncbi:aldo-keto reductase family 1 member A1-A [Caerostris darwini]|uniref:Aldo-keto reductase family 1 member A1-A n=1 Tax=Caerostris darwini TaxID=1538125 RepID=A0AAV4W4S6_9ARAC|nr:aldo-keto reductase family 1 member A1-A [Caerostris darwini]